MTPKEKAIELYNKFYNTSSHPHHIESRKDNAKKYALIAVDEILDVLNGEDFSRNAIVFWTSVKQEIEAL